MDLIKKYSELYAWPFLSWIFMWVNAIKDVALFVDWPDCIFYKSDLIYKTHDLFSNLKTPNIDTKLYFSWAMPNKMVLWYEEDIRRKLWNIVNNKKINQWFITNMPVTWLLAVQYDNIYDDLDKNFIYIPSFTDKFRIDWYQIFLKEIAKNIEIKNTEKNKNSFALIWYLFDRNEWDNLWNISELRRIFKNLWVEINCVWLDWGNFNDLKNVEKSELIVSLPYWKMAWKILSKRLWVKNIELEVPFWIKSIIDFVKKICLEFDLDQDFVNQYLKMELNDIKTKVDMLDDYVFLNKNVIYAWDPNLLENIRDITEYLWMNLVFSYSYLWDKQPEWQDFNNKNINLVIWNSDFNNQSNFKIDYEKKLEFWFPSYNTHYLVPTPFMWFEWMKYFIQSIYNKLNN